MMKEAAARRTPSRPALPIEPRSSRGRILLIDDEEVIADNLQEFLQTERYDVRVAPDAPTALKLVAEFEPDVALCDLQLPGLDGLDILDRVLRLRPDTLVMMITAYATVETAVTAFRRGAQDYLMKPVLFDELLAKLDRLMSYRALLRENQGLRRQLHHEQVAESLVGSSKAMETVRSLVRKVGPTRSTVLITGESGTGKELVARALHAQGPEPDAPFLAINCAAIPQNLLENQLFGHVRGAFTGADRDHDGLFVAASRGTVFLDEIGELPAATQAKLLRAIEAREVLPVGATRPIKVTARVVAATNRDLPAEVAAGHFRADLYYRLNVVAIRTPPLRDRPEDIPEIVPALLARHAAQLGKRINGVDNAAMRWLLNAPWRGNVRELDNALERAMILADGPILTAADFAHGLEAEPISEEDEDDLRLATNRFERQHIQRVLIRCNGDKREAARRLGLALSSLYRKLETEEGGPEAG